MDSGQAILQKFVEQAALDARALNEQSDVVRIERLPVADGGLFRIIFAVAYLARVAGGRVDVAPGPLPVMVRIGPDYLTHASPLETVQVHERAFWHPNFRWPVLCVGALRPGMTLTALVRHVYEIITYQNISTDDGLDLEACVRIRNGPELLDRLPRTPPLRRPTGRRMEAR